MNIKIGSCHANLILLQAKPVSCVLIADIFYFFGREEEIRKQTFYKK